MSGKALETPVEAETAKDAVVVATPEPYFAGRAYERDENVAREVRTLAKLFPPAGERLLARRLGITITILRDHYAPELELGRGELIASLASQEVALAMDASAGVDTPGKPAVAKGDPHARRWVLTKMGGWVTKQMHEVSGPGGGPILNATIDLSKLNHEQLTAYGRLSAIVAGIDPDTIIAVPIDD